jgi:transcriptional regulator with XRE-family HTH domain
MLNGPRELEDWRTRRGFRTYVDLAEYLGWDPTYISHLVNGRRVPDLPNALHLERMTGIPVEAWAPKKEQD